MTHNVWKKALAIIITGAWDHTVMWPFEVTWGKVWVGKPVFTSSQIKWFWVKTWWDQRGHVMPHAFCLIIFEKVWLKMRNQTFFWCQRVVPAAVQTWLPGIKVICIVCLLCVLFHSLLSKPEQPLKLTLVCTSGAKPHAGDVGGNSSSGVLPLQAGLRGESQEAHRLRLRPLPLSQRRPHRAQPHERSPDRRSRCGGDAGQTSGCQRRRCSWPEVRHQK